MYAAEKSKKGIQGCQCSMFRIPLKTSNVLGKRNSGLNRRITLKQVNEGDRGNSPDLTS